MLPKLLIAWGLMALCVAVHAVGVTSAIRWVRLHPVGLQSLWGATRLLILVAGWIIFLHLIEITLWGAFYTWQRAMPDLPTGLYFSAVTYTTTGYGDLVLPSEWRVVGGVEALTGILLSGWSTGFFFVIFSRMYEPADSRSTP
jgi:voltage-gated potassium channel Kch